MRGLLLATLVVTAALYVGPQLLAAQTSTTSPTDDQDTDVPRGASDDSGVFNPVWIVVVAIGFVSLVLGGMFWARRRRPGSP